MKRNGYSLMTFAVIAMMAIAGSAFATPNPNGANLNLRTFNDCPISTLTPVNAYPASISITDAMDPACVGFANLHGWSFSTDGGATAALFENNSAFIYCATVVIDGPGQGEGGLRFSPWWSQFADGRFMINAEAGHVPAGEIACFGGRMPFYSFTGNHGISYVKGTPIFMQISYLANGLSAASPATIQYKVIYNAVTYDSPWLAYDEGNTAEDPPHGLWGCLNEATVGGYFQPRANSAASLSATWSNICFTDTRTPVQTSTWGRMKTLYR
ncbi:MAG TPA: hypothetical protein VJY35_14840 [Candidatus Eisenbacteria bacterium]|nr:hypothetical protein [Candidatus Eisenbacteria bacterium]